MGLLDLFRNAGAILAPVVPVVTSESFVPTYEEGIFIAGGLFGKQPISNNHWFATAETTEWLRKRYKADWVATQNPLASNAGTVFQYVDKAGKQVEMRVLIFKGGVVLNAGMDLADQFSWKPFWQADRDCKAIIDIAIQKGVRP